jgi:hypothetical protein
MQCACAVFVACPGVHYFATLSHKLQDFREKKPLKIVFRFSVQLVYEIFLILKRTERDIKNCIGHHAEYPLFLSDFN